MSMKISHSAYFAALMLLFALPSQASAEDDQASSFGNVAYKALDPLQLGKEPKPLYEVDAYFRLKELREIAARDRGTYLIPSETGQDPRGLGRDAKPLYDVASYFRIKETREIAAKEKGTFVVPSNADQVPNELGKEAKPVYDVDANLKLKGLREIGSKEKKSFSVPSKIRA